MPNDEKQKLTNRLKEAVHKRSFFGKVREIAARRMKAANERVQREVGAVDTARRAFEKASDDPAVSRQRLVNLERELRRAEHRLRAQRRKREFWRNRYVWADARHRHWGSVWRNRKNQLNRWVRRHQGFQPYMANGHPYTKLTDEAKHAIYLDFRDGLYVTSTYEGYPGDGVHSTSSGHYVQNQPDGKARCWDAGASSRGPMVKAQKREARRAGAYCAELIGPDNSANYKNGIRYTLSEGSALETMHDNHKHQWLRDGAPTE